MDIPTIRTQLRDGCSNIFVCFSRGACASLTISCLLSVLIISSSELQLHRYIFPFRLPTNSSILRYIWDASKCVQFGVVRSVVSESRGASAALPSPELCDVSFNVYPTVIQNLACTDGGQAGRATSSTEGPQLRVIVLCSCRQSGGW